MYVYGKFSDISSAELSSKMSGHFELRESFKDILRQVEKPQKTSFSADMAKYVDIKWMSFFYFIFVCRMIYNILAALSFVGRIDTL